MYQRIAGFFFIAVFCFYSLASAQQTSSAKLVEVKNIWEQGDYNSFTDLIIFKDKLYCAFREAKRHGVSTDGSIRILVSNDANTWKSRALICSDKGDLRDPHLTVTPDNKLMLSVCIAKLPHPALISASYFSSDGINWSEDTTFGELNSWLWRVTWKDDTAYGFTYRCKDPYFIQLLKSTDGKEFSKIGEPCFEGVYNNETSTIIFQDDGTALCLLRCSGPAHLGTAKPPYDNWTWKELDKPFGGPEMIKLPDGRIVACGRLYDNPVRTSLCWVDPKAGTFTEFLTLPSGGDTSYPGMVWHDDMLLVSYYSSHEGTKARIYLAKVEFGNANGSEKPIELSSELEPFIDRYLIDSLSNALHISHEPKDEGKVLKFDRPWEGPFCAYCTMIKARDRYQLYYRGVSKPSDNSSAEVTCYAESKDGINWVKPDLGLYEVHGTRENNVILANAAPVTHNFSPFLDNRKGVAAEQRYKAIGGSPKSGMVAYISSDGIRWKKLRPKPIFERSGWVFDSQNVAFWSEANNRYELYYREVPQGVRAIGRTTSKDFLNWTEPTLMSYSETGATIPENHLYTNQTHPYFRAPHIYISTAARFMPGRKVITDAEAREINVHPGYFGDTSDSVLMTTRGGAQYDCTFKNALIKPGIGYQNWVSRTNYPALNIVPTGQNEMSLYVNQDYGQPTAHLRRYSMRLDGLASVTTKQGTGEMITKPFVLKKPKLATDKKIISGPITVSADKPIFGKKSLLFEEAASITLPKTRKLGSKVTLAAHIRNVPAGHRRLFSTYNGGSSQPEKLYFDFNSNGNVEGGAIRFGYNGLTVNAAPDKVGNFSASKDPKVVHHIAATWDDGIVTIYFNGKQVAKGGKNGLGAMSFDVGDLRFGEDYPPTSLNNEPFLGSVDDILVLKRALSPTEIAKLAYSGAAEALQYNKADGVLLTMEGESGSLISDALTRDGKQDVTIPARTMALFLNFATSAAGEIRVEVQDAIGQRIQGFYLEDSRPLIGNSIERPVFWNTGADLGELIGQTIRLRFVMKDTDLYAMQFKGL